MYGMKSDNRFKCSAKLFKNVMLFNWYRNLPNTGKSLGKNDIVTCTKADTTPVIIHSNFTTSVTGATFPLDMIAFFAIM